MACKSHNYFESELYMIFAEMLDMDILDNKVFETSVKEIISMPDGSLEVKFFDGTTKIWNMPPPPQKKPKPKPERKRPKHIFDGKIFCGQCGRRYGRAVSESRDRHLYWYCRAKSSHGVTCDSVNYPDSEIKEIFCGIMEQETFDEGYFLKTVERIVVQKTGSIDFQLKDGTVKTYKTLKLRNSVHRTTSTDEFIGKIKCASCGSLYHRYTAYGKYVYWRCAGKSKVRTECCGKDLADFNIRTVSAYIMGVNEFDGAGFEKQIKGITGCNTKKRDGFNKMVEDALAGQIDLIITKSVSRFARNTVDSLTTIRRLKESGVECYLEKENIWTFDGKGELLLTTMSSLAQEESRSISENCTWGQRKRFADGKVTVPFKRFLGYDRGEDGNLVVNEEQAKTVRRIYGLFLQGRSPYAIAKILMADGIPSPGGKKTWASGTVKSILTNEKYKGDALLQKVHTVDFLSKKKKVNEREVPQYYVEGNHPAIISPQEFDAVQKQMALRCPGKNRQSCVSTFSSKIKCGDCGSWYGSKVWHSTSKYRKTIWQYNHKFDGGEKCTTPHLDEETIKELFVKAVNIFLTEKDEIIENFNAIKDTLFDLWPLETERSQLQEELNAVARLVQQCIKENARIALDQKEYQKRYDGMAKRLDSVQGRLDEVSQNITEKQARREKIEMFFGGLQKQKGLVTGFDEDLWYSLIEYVTVFSKENIRFTFKDGTEIKV